MAWLRVAAGVKVTGGSTGIGDGMVKYANGSLGLVWNGEDALRFSNEAGREGYIGFYTNQPSSPLSFRLTDFDDAVAVYCDFTPTHNGSSAESVNVRSSWTQAVGSAITTAKIFEAVSGTVSGVTGTLTGFEVGASLAGKATDGCSGFRSLIPNSNEDSNFNFLASGGAPNFFQGDTYIGGTATRNTRELWESTLTEEQKEQLAAGTLAIPANVSTPGDGSFVRQWWYNQQSAEDQALIDAGELEYPERYQAANFVDTFDLGVTTNINLMSNGRGEFGFGIRLLGGSASSASAGGNAGIYKNNDGHFVVALDNSNHSNFSLGRGIRVTNIVPDGTTESSGFYSQSSLASVTGLVDEHIGIRSSITNGGNKIKSYIGVASDDCANLVANEAGATGVGFYSDVNNSGSKPNAAFYNFYANGSAPNYFAGTVTVGTLDNNPASNNVTGISLVNGTIEASRQGKQSLILNRRDAATPENTRAVASFENGDTSVGGITTDGATVSFFDGTSDYRLKTNVSPLVNAADAISQINVVNFEYTHANVGHQYQGFIAHELQEIAPAAVSGVKDGTEAIGTLYDYDGTVLQAEVTEPPAEDLTYTEETTDSEGVTTQNVRTRTWTATGTRPVYQGVDQTKLIPLLTKALQESLDKIEVLEQRLSDAGIA